MNKPLQKEDIDHLQEPEVNEDLAFEHGLNHEEYNLILDILDRKPTFTELGIFSVMWSEHCSYKSSRVHLKKLPTKAPWVIQGPGENAGVIDIQDGQAAIFKMESHNHPSFIEPYQGAATGVGGIMRDVFTMGARPIANINALRFGSPDNAKTRHLLSGVVAGIAGYGNCMGVPTVGGEVNFHDSYNGNILVNAMTVGLADTKNIYYARGAEANQPVVYVGSKTGRDGIHGATMASAEFGDGNEENRPTVQVGDPFTEKLLLEACLELMQENAIISIQDMGAAGLTSSSVEIADKGKIGIELNLDHVPQRETHMSPYELMLSESQERMLMILEPGKEDLAKKIFEKWDLDFAVIGTTTKERTLRLTMYGKTWCDIPVPPLVDDAPIYNRPIANPVAQNSINFEDFTPDNNEIIDILKSLISCPDMASKEWIWEQYDYLVQGETILSPGQADAALVKVNERKALAISSDCTPRYCRANPFKGGKQAVAESYRNLSATGAKPLAITNNLNFGNPEKPEIMAQFAGCIEGMAEACKELSYPVISGNVSLYNETSGQAIYPTPVIGGVGLLTDYRKAVGLGFKQAGQTIAILGHLNGHIGQSLYLREIHKQESGEPPEVDLEQELTHGTVIQDLIDKGLVHACHDISDGGLLCCLADMCMKHGVGATIDHSFSNSNQYFSEDQGCYVIASEAIDEIIKLDSMANIPLTLIGKTGGDELTLEGCGTISVRELTTLNQAWLREYMESI